MTILRVVISRSHSTSAKARIDYLNTWVGSKKDFQGLQGVKSSQQQQQQHHHQQQHATPHLAPQYSASPHPAVSPQQLTINGGNFLLPTLRISRGATGASLAAALSHATNASPASRALLGRRPNGVPLVLDLASFCPDGSPHFKPLSKGELKALVNDLRSVGLLPIAVTNSSNGGGLEQVAAATGLPTVMRGVGARETGAPLSIADVLRVVSDVVPSSSGVKESESEEEDDEASSAPLVAVASFAAAATDPSLFNVLSRPLTAAARTSAAAPTLPPPQTSTPAPSADEAEASSPPPPPPSLAPAAAPPRPSMLYRGTVRSGQQVSAPEGCSLVVLGSVSSGGEVLSDCDVFVYGRLKGRALAGLGGRGGRIIATSLDAELVCVGGVFKTMEDVDTDGSLKRGEGGVVSLDEETGELKFDSLDIL